MWFLPLRITLELKKTRTSWTLTIRVFFNNRKQETGESLSLTPRCKHNISQHFSNNYLFHSGDLCSNNRGRWFPRHDTAGDEKGTR